MSLSLSAMTGDSSWWYSPVSQPTGSGQTAVTKDPAATNGGELSSLFQQFSSDLGSMLAQFSPGTAASDAATTSATTSAATSATTPTATGVHHHHHPHRGSDTVQAAANQLVGQIAGFLNSGTATSTASIGNTLATDVMNALKSYGAVTSGNSATQQTTTAISAVA